MVVGRQSINTNNSLFDWISMDAMNSLNESSLVSTGGSGGEEEAAALDSLSIQIYNLPCQTPPPVHHPQPYTMVLMNSWVQRM